MGCPVPTQALELELEGSPSIQATATSEVGL
jgi:hypothetical protein